MACARKLAASHRLLITSKSERIRQIAEELGSLGADVISFPADLTDPDQAAGLIDKAIHRFGRLDVLVADPGPGGRLILLRTGPWRAASSGT